LPSALNYQKWNRLSDRVVPPLKEQMLKAIATLAVVAPLGMAHVNVYGDWNLRFPWSVATRGHTEQATTL
jgi:hypothetical protein